MAQDPQITFGPWPKGINNRATEGDLETGAGDAQELRDAINLDIENSGRVRRRLGTDRVYAGSSVRSVYSTGKHLLFAEGQTLKRGLPTPVTLRSDMTPDKRVSYAQINNTVYYSDGVVSGRLLPDDTHLLHWNVDKPAAAPTLAVGAGGALHPGRYRVKVTFLGLNGEEGPASPEAALDINLGEHVSITAFPTTTDAFVNRMRVYITNANDDVFYGIQELPIATATSDIFSLNAALGSLGTNLLAPFPPVDLVDYFAGRLWGAIGKVLWFSESMRYGLITPRHNFFMFTDEISVIAPCEDGIYVVSDKTYWLAGRNPKEMQRQTVNDHKGVKYSAVRIKNTPRVLWFSPYGYMIGGPGGNVAAISENRVAANLYGEGATLFREQGGIRQVVGNFVGGVESQFQATDYADMTIIRSGA